ncbi:MAG: ribonuclease HI family protein [Actinomycetia bacterium]|nr:ribonuclease HI family protein [Actinomycetes bacterium]
MITAAADGSSLSNPGPAGWAWYIDPNTWAAGGWPLGTNNMGELMAVLDLLRQTAIAADETLRVLCDSQYAINAVTKWMPAWKARGWRKADGKPVLNRDLLEAIDLAIRGRDVVFEWVKGHAGHRLNEAADLRARAAATAFAEHRPVPAGPGFAGSTIPSVSLDVRPAMPVLPEPDLFGTGADSGPDPVIDGVAARERALLSDPVRRSPLRLRELLHPDYVLYDAGGHIYTRPRLLTAVPPDRAPDLELLGASRLGSDAVLLRWRERSGGTSALRSSVWTRADDRDWQAVFTQSTAVA